MTVSTTVGSDQKRKRRRAAWRPSNDGGGGSKNTHPGGVVNPTPSARAPTTVRRAMSYEPPPPPPFSVRHERFRDSLRPSGLREFAALTDDPRRIRYAYERLYAADERGDDRREDRRGKDGDASLEMKRSGTACFRKSDYRAASDWYSLALLRCPHTEDWLVQLSVIYANRSACLYRLGDYHRAVSDIRRALDNGYPKELRYKVDDRMARCMLATGQWKSAAEWFGRAADALDESGLSPDRLGELRADVRNALAAMDGKTENEPAKTGRLDVPDVYGGRNDAYPAASDAMSFGYNASEGRHATARRDVPVGSVLLVERAYASVLLRQYDRSHCTNCFIKLVAPLPCPECDAVAFCGGSCEKVALGTYHAVECPLLPELHAAGLSITCLIALRIITQRPLTYFTDLRPRLNHTEKPREDHATTTDDGYADVYNLVGHRRSRSDEDVLHRTHVAAFYLHCLKNGTRYFFADADARGLTDDEAFVGSLLLHHLMVLPFNTFEVSELRPPRTVFVGGSVYPTLALFNHSCDPCVVRYHRGTTVVVRSVRDLRAGEPITENYGPMFMFHPIEERRRTLKTRYWFECNCIACCQDWPTLEQMETHTSLRIRCTNCRNAITVTAETMEFAVHCKVCSKTTNLLAALKVLQDTEDKYSEAKQLMDKNNYEKALPKFMALLSLLHKHLVPPFKDYHLCQQAIRQCMLSFGNKF